MLNGMFLHRIQHGGRYLPTSLHIYTTILQKYTTFFVEKTYICIKNFGEQMKQGIKDMTVTEWVVVALTACAVLAIGAGLLFPPPGEIHNSVLIAVGELFGFASLFTVILAIKQGTEAEVKHGDTTVRVGASDPDDDGE